MSNYSARALALSLLICFVLLVVTGGGDVAKADPVAGPSVIITFDDIGGLNSVAMTGYILPQMNSYGYKGVGFVVGTWSQALSVGQALADAGWEIGSHTMTHPHLDELSSSALTYELVSSKTFLESNIVGAAPVLSFAYPFGEGNENAAVLSLVQASYRLARDAGGYSSGVTWDGVARFDIMPYTIDDSCVIGEYIYRDFDSSRIVSAGDVRLTAVPPYSAGSTVAAGDSDIESSLVAFASLEKHRENMDADRAYDVGEYIYRDVDGSKKVSVGDVRLTAVPPYSAGSTVAAGDSDIRERLVAFASLEKHRENIATNGAYDVGEYIYREVDSMGVSVGDLRLTVVGSYAAGSTVAAGDGDIGSSLIVFTSLEKHRENVAADSAYNVGEYIYRDVGSGNTGAVGVGDVRLTAVGSYYAGSTVAAGNSDIGSSLVAFASFEKHRENMNANSAYDVSNVDRALLDAKSTGRNVVLMSHGADITSANFAIVLGKISAAISRGEISGVATFKDVMGAPLYLVVRGYSNGIYYRSYNGSSWDDWIQLPGATPNGTASAVFQSSLHIVVNGLDGALYWGTVNLTDSEFSGWTRLLGATPSAPTLAASTGYLCLVVQDYDNDIYYRVYDGSSWGSWNPLPGATMTSPGAAISANRFLHVVVTGMYGGLYWGFVDLTTMAFSGWTELDGATPSRPTLASSSDSLYLVVRGYNDGIWYRSYNGLSWSSWSQLPGATSQSPAAEVYNNSLHVVVVGFTGGLFWGDISLATSEFSGWTWLDGATPSEPSLTC